MATTRAKALRRAGLDERIAAAGQTLAARFGVELPTAGPAPKDTDLAILTERERFAALLEAICAATDPDAEPYDPDPSRMKRADLNAYAAERGIVDAHRLPNIAAVIAAIEAAGDADMPDPKRPPTEPNEPTDDNDGDEWVTGPLAPGGDEGDAGDGEPDEDGE